MTRQFVNWDVKEMTELFYTLSRLDHKSSVIWTSIFEGPYHRNTRKVKRTFQKLFFSAKDIAI
jgi:hypothetical protein